MNSAQFKEYLHQCDLSPFLPRDKRGKGFVCPICSNGSGSSGDGLSRIPLSNSYKCFKCGESGDVFFWIGRKFGLDGFPAQLRKAAELYGIALDNDGFAPAYVTKDSHEKTIPSDENAEKYISACSERASQTDYFKKRGLSDDIVKRFRLGYDPDFREGTGREPWKAVIIPTSPCSYEGRNIAVSPNSKDGAGFKCRKHGKTVIFNGECFASEKERPIFITEGCFDALSIIECGGQAAALGGVSNTGLLASMLDKVTPSVPLLLALDNDDAGKAAAQKLEKELDSRGVPYINVSSELMGGFHDPNDRLLQDRQGLCHAVRSIADKAAEVLGSPKDKQREEYLRSSAVYSVGELREFIKEASRRPPMSTGFYSLDKALGGGLYPGLYVLGAVSSLGKTTFVLQMADDLAQMGTDVLFFSLEQSRFELMAKSISRESFNLCMKNKLSTKYAFSSLRVLNGSIDKASDPNEQYVINSAFERYCGYASRLFIYEGVGNISVGEIREKLRDHIAYTGFKRPVVFIDYLQILRAADGDERATDKQMTDRNITYLKQLSRDFDIPVIAVSSLNRQNYSERINMAAFKESGAIEYGSDVLMGLQLKGAGERDFDITAAKEKDPRETELIILKNRSGAVSSKGIELNYYPVFNCFRAPLEVYERP